MLPVSSQDRLLFIGGPLPVRIRPGPNPDGAPDGGRRRLQFPIVFAKPRFIMKVRVSPPLASRGGFSFSQTPSERSTGFPRRLVRQAARPSGARAGVKRT